MGSSNRLHTAAGGAGPGAQSGGTARARRRPALPGPRPQDRPPGVARSSSRLACWCQGRSACGARRSSSASEAPDGSSRLGELLELQRSGHRRAHPYPCTGVPDSPVVTAGDGRLCPSAARCRVHRRPDGAEKAALRSRSCTPGAMAIQSPSGASHPCLSRGLS